MGGCARGTFVMQETAESDWALLDAAARGHLLATGPVHALLPQRRGRVFPDEIFEDLFPSGQGRPSVPGEVTAGVFVIQALVGLSDRAARSRL